MNKEKAPNRRAGVRSLFMRKMIGIAIALTVLMPIMGTGTAVAAVPSIEYVPMEQIPINSHFGNQNWNPVTYSVYNCISENPNCTFIETATKDPSDNQYYTKLDADHLGLQRLWVTAEHDSVVDSVYFNVTITNIRQNWPMPLLIFKEKAPFSLALNQLFAFDSTTHPVIVSATADDPSILDVKSSSTGITLKALTVAASTYNTNITVTVNDSSKDITKQEVIPIEITDTSSILSQFSGILQSRGRPLAVQLPPSSQFKMDVIPLEAFYPVFLSFMAPDQSKKYLESLNFQQFNVDSSSAVIPTTDLQGDIYFCLFFPVGTSQPPLVQTLEVIDLGDASSPAQRVGIASLVKYFGKNQNLNLTNHPERFLDLIEPISLQKSIVPTSIVPTDQ